MPPENEDSTTTHTTVLPCSIDGKTDSNAATAVSSKSASEAEREWTNGARVYEYGDAANPDLSPIPVLVHPAALHESGATREIPFDASDALGIDAPCTSPNLLASFLRINVGDGLVTRAPQATSQAFYVIRGSGRTTVSASSDNDNDREERTIAWSTGDVFCHPCTSSDMLHVCSSAESCGGAALYWIHDEPLMRYLGAAPTARRFEPTLHKSEDVLRRVDEIRHDTGACHERNRLGVLLGNAAFDANTRTLTHVLWSLLNALPARTVQRPHRHNSVALDLCVSRAADGDGAVYTLMGREINGEGVIVDPVRCDWTPGSVFVTPPGWWHSHHNESDADAWVLPVQDAGLYTHQRTLDIRFVDDEVSLFRAGRIRGTAFAVTDRQYTEMVSVGARVPEHKEDDDAAGLRRVISAECLLSRERTSCTQIARLD